MKPLYSKKFLVKTILSLLIFALPFVFFQNCSKMESDSASRKNSNLNTTDPQNTTTSDDSQNGTRDSGLSAKVVTTNSLSRDCSLADSSYSYQIDQAGTDILLCQEYTLDMPVGSPRRGEKKLCTDPSQFTTPSADWVYNTADRRWNKNTQTRNHSYLVPGDYILVVKDNQGKIFRSNLLRVRHYGYSNCMTPSSSGSSTTSITCSWSGDDFSPAQPPTSDCNQNRANVKELGASGVEYTCVCTKTTATGSTPSDSNGADSPTQGSGGTKCNPPGTTIVNMGQLNGKNMQTGQVIKNWWQDTSYYPKDNEIRVWSFTTANLNELEGSTNGIPFTTNSIDTATIPGTSVASGVSAYPALVVSNCPGDTRSYKDTAASSALEISCSKAGTEAVGIQIVVTPSPQELFNVFREKKITNKCYLKSNTTYYVSAFSSDRPLQNGKLLPSLNCTKPHCGFYFSAR
jgi:hypothetical protein